MDQPNIEAGDNVEIEPPRSLFNGRSMDELSVEAGNNAEIEPPRNLINRGSTDELNVEAGNNAEIEPPRNLINRGSTDELNVEAGNSEEIEPPRSLINIGSMDEPSVEAGNIVEIEPPRNHINSRTDEPNVDFRNNVEIQPPRSPVIMRNVILETDEANEPDLPKAKRPRLDISTTDDEAKSCAICLTECKITGEHKFTTIKCGHYFGEACIVQWLKVKKQCPVCRKRSLKKDVRPLFVKKVAALDISKRLVLEEEMANLKVKKKELDLKICKKKYNISFLEGKIQQLKKDMSILQRKVSCNELSQSSVSTNTQSKYIRLKKYQTYAFGNDVSRSMDFRKHMNVIVASSQESNDLFKNMFGMKLVDVATNKLLSHLFIHQKVVKDLKFHPSNPWVLSVSQDKTFHITDIGTKKSFAKYSLNSQGWSCNWNEENGNLLYIGEQQGGISIFDVRNLSQCVCSLEASSDRSPVIALSLLTSNGNLNILDGGILACKLSSVLLFKKKDDITYTEQKLPIDGPFVSMQYSNKSNHMLVSGRPNSQELNSRHIVCEFESNEDGIQCNINHTFTGGPIQSRLSRSCLFYRDREFVSAHDEASKSVILWDVNNHKKVQTIYTEEPVLDICYLDSNYTSTLACLSEKRIDFFRIT